MKDSEKLRKRINARNELELFSFNHMVQKNDSHAAISKEFSRLHANGVIKRLRNGIYYKPKMSRFGEIQPSEKDVLKYLLFEKGKQVGYVSGERSHNYLGLTSQVPSVITIATNQERRSGKFAGLRIRYVKAYERVRKDNVYLMQILDAIKDVHRILDANVSESLYSLYQMVEQLSSEKKQKLVKIAANYPPRVRAVVGAMMSGIWKSNPEYKVLLESLGLLIVNSSRFGYPNSYDILSDIKSWNINEIASA